MLLYFPEYKVRFVKIPKNACSTIITTLGHSVTRGTNPHGFDSVFSRQMPASSDWPIIGVYRDPYDRLVSAYLNKIVSPDPNETFATEVVEYIWESQRGKKRPSSFLSVTLREFAIYVCGHPDSDLDQHWQSQSHFFNEHPPDVYFRMDLLDEQWGGSELVGHIPLRRHSPHAVSATLPFGEGLPDMPGEAIRGFQMVTGGSPEKSRFFDHHIAAMVRHRYVEDYEIIARVEQC